jgi:hypothetical protein
MATGIRKMKKIVETTVDEQPDTVSPERVTQPRQPRYSVFRFLLGSTAAIALAATIWPALPRHYVSEATLIIQPSGASNVENLNVSAALRQPLDESAILSEVDTLRSDFLLDRLMQEHALLHDPEFSAPGRVTQLRMQIAGLIAPDAAVHARWEQPVSQQSGEHLEYQGPVARLEEQDQPDRHQHPVDDAVERIEHPLPREGR